jgi:uncharacterized protein (DUF302 family)
MITATGYTLTTTTTAPFAEAVERVRDELKEDGFGVLCEIDVQTTLREKLVVEYERYTILGACNPPLAHQALSAEPELGTLLPCNVVVYEQDGEIHISAIDAERMLSTVGNDELAPVAAKVRAKLAAIVERAANSRETQAPPPDRGWARAWPSAFVHDQDRAVGPVRDSLADASQGAEAVQVARSDDHEVCLA